MDQSIFSTAFAHPAGSPIRELFPYLSRPGMISFAGGYPSPSLFDLEGLQQAAQQALNSRTVFQYGASEGQIELREQLAALGAARGIPAEAGNLLVTTGSQQGFDLLVRVLINPGDIALVELPAYPATLQALRLAGARIIGIPTDDHGLDTAYLADMLAAWPTGPKPKLLYTVPNFSNPGGTLLAAPRREQLAALAQEHGFLVIEDDPYGELNFSGASLPTVYQCGAELASSGANPVVYLSSLSKTVSPALRIGWMAAPAELLRRCTIAKQTADLCTSPISQAIAAEYLQLGRYQATVENSTAVYRERMELLTSLLAQELQDQARFVKPGGGMFLWLSLGATIDTQALFQAAVDAGVLYVPGKAFYPDQAQPGTMRLSFAGPNLEQIRTGTARLTQAVNSLASA